MPISNSLGGMLGPDSVLLHPALLLPAALIAVLAAYSLCSRAAPAKAVAVAAEAPPSKLPDPTPYEGFVLKTARTRDFIYANKVSSRRDACFGSLEFVELILSFADADASLPLFSNDGAPADAH